MTPDLLRTFNAVAELTARLGQPPTIAEIATETGEKSKSQAHKRVMRLVRNGHLSHTPGKRRSIKVVAKQRQRDAAVALLSRCVVQERAPTADEMGAALGLGGRA